MNKMNAAIALIMGINAGMQIVSILWSPSPEKIPLALMFIAVGVLFIIRTENAPKKNKEDVIIDTKKES